AAPLRWIGIRRRAARAAELIGNLLEVAFSVVFAAPADPPESAELGRYPVHRERHPGHDDVVALFQSATSSRAASDSSVQLISQSPMAVAILLSWRISRSAFIFPSPTSGAAAPRAVPHPDAGSDGDRLSRGCT